LKFWIGRSQKWEVRGASIVLGPRNVGGEYRVAVRREWGAGKKKKRQGADFFVNPLARPHERLGLKLRESMGRGGGGGGCCVGVNL